MNLPKHPILCDGSKGMSYALLPPDITIACLHVDGLLPKIIRFGTMQVCVGWKTYDNRRVFTECRIQHRWIYFCLCTQSFVGNRSRFWYLLWSFPPTGSVGGFSIWRGTAAWEWSVEWSQELVAHSWSSRECAAAFCLDTSLWSSYHTNTVIMVGSLSWWNLKLDHWEFLNWLKMRGSLWRPMEKVYGSMENVNMVCCSIVPWLEFL